MPTKSGRNGDRRWLGALGLVLLPILCCGLPLLIAAGGLGVIGSVLRNPFVIGVALLILLGLVVWAVRRRSSGSPVECSPETQDRQDNREDRMEL